MRLNFILFILLLLNVTANAQKLTGIWRGYFSSANSMFREGQREENYKYEIQLDQQSTNGIKGVTYSYKTTVFYGKAEISGIYSPSSKSLIIKESKLVDLKIGDKSEPCLMTCYLDYSRIGKMEVLEGTFISINVKDKGDCGSGKVYLEKVTNSDFKKEDFLLQKKNVDSTRNKTQVNNSGRKPSPSVSTNNKDNLLLKAVPRNSTDPMQRKPAIIAPNQKASVTNKKQSEKQNTHKPAQKEDKSPVVTRPAERIPADAVNSKKNNAEETSQTEITSRKIQIPRVLVERENNLVRTITTSEEDIEVNLYDNGTIDNDTISVYHNNQLVISNGRLTYSPLTFKIKCTKTDNRHELTVVAENLGDIPPNTALMVIKAGSTKERYEIFLASTEQRNAKVVINYVPKK